MRELAKTYNEAREDIFVREGRKYPGKALVDMELRPGYNEAKEKKIWDMLAINEAHLIMLVEQGIVSKEDGRILFECIENMDYRKYESYEYSGKFEDLFFEIENEQISLTNGLAGNIHLARSRNDMCLCLDHMVFRRELLKLIELLVEMQNTVKLFAQEHKDTLYVAYTHAQHAQPSVLGHYYLGLFDVLNRDIERLQHAYKQINGSVMGAAAITTTGFPINRQRVAELLGFDYVIENSFDAIGNIDFMTETASALGLAALNLGRVITDMVTWATEGMDMIILADGYISTSSIMPQKRNPIALEHLRSSLSMVKGLADAIHSSYLKSPYGDISDHEDITAILSQCISLLETNYRTFNAVMGTLDVNAGLLRERAYESFAVVTEVADEIVRVCHIPFRSAHHVVATMVKEAGRKGYNLKDMEEDFFTPIYKMVTGKDFDGDFSLIRKAMDPQAFVDSRNIYGGCGPKAMENMLISAGEKQQKSLEWLRNAHETIDKATAKRKTLIEEFLK
ncbi:MAG: argininosuccinate lyase [Candidatus Ornithospirochaeta sp.]|nr:argininosuccinate lyase [Candidatus Ornithospirochaeta sp.]